MKERDKFGLKGSRQVRAFLGRDRESCKRENEKKRKGKLEMTKRGSKNCGVKARYYEEKCLSKNAYVP